jgi:hypothetical protein
MPELRTLMTGLVIGESPRWHQDHLWFSHWGAEEIIAVDVEGNSEVAAPGPPGLGWSIDWLPDGRLLVTGQQLLRREADGSLVTHADLSGVSDGWNEIVVDGRGNIYVNSVGLPLRGRGIPSRKHRAGHPRRLGWPGGRRHRVPQWHGRHTRQFHADRLRVLRRQAHGVRHRRRRRPVEPPGLGRGPGARRYLRRRRRRRLDLDRSQRLCAGRRRRRDPSADRAGPEPVRLHAGGHGQNDPVLARRRMAHAGERPRQPLSADQRTSHRPGAGRPGTAPGAGWP